MIGTVAAAVAALGGWYVVSSRRRMQVTSVMVPEAEGVMTRSSVRDRRPKEDAGLSVGSRAELLRSLERMEADLAALRAEVERMRDQVRRAPRESAPPQQ